MGTRAETTRKEKALLGAKKGAVVDVDAPAGKIQYKIISIKK